MKDLTANYRLSLYTEVIELSKGKVYIVKSSLDDRIYIKKVLALENYKIYKEIQKLEIANIPKIYEIINLEDKLVIIEEYINGYSLEEILEDSKRLSEKQVIDYMLDLIDILEELHFSSSNIIHRDIKPSNLMVNNDGILKLIDFDISRQHNTEKTNDTTLLGTFGYAAPEQFGFNQSDARTDIYSIGVTMNMLLTGQLPKDEMYEGGLSRVISTCIEMDSKRRFQDIGELKNALSNQKIINDNKNRYIDKKERLPGFRSDSILVKIGASFWYLLIFMAAVGYLSEEPLSDDRIDDIVVSIFLLALTLLFGNYRDIKNKLPLTRSRNIITRILGYFLYVFLLLLAAGTVLPT